MNSSNRLCCFLSTTSQCSCSVIGGQTFQSFTLVKKKDCAGFANCRKLSRDHPVQPWVDSLPYLPSPPLRL